MRVFAPGTVANLGVGFDVLGLALAAPGDVIRAAKSTKAGAQILAIRGDDGQLPRDERNTAQIAADETLRLIGAAGGVALEIEKGIPLASGLGSSAASAVAAAYATNLLYGKRLSSAELMRACLEAEAAVSGRHADNIAPALYGGITLIRGDAVQLLPVPDGAWLALIRPALAIPTASARALLPAQVPLAALTRQTAAIARLVDALHRADWPAAAEAIEADGIIEPARASLIPGLAAARAAAKSSGALALFISGAGPTLCALCLDERIARASAAAVSATFADQGIDSNAYLTRISARGVRRLADESDHPTADI